jgi:hypothetical protein
MPEIIFPSKWLKADVNVKEGDTITFLNTGEFDKKQEQWVFKVRVNRTGDEKLFGLNKKTSPPLKHCTEKTVIHGSART